MSIDLMASEIQRADLVRRGRWLEYFTIVWNAIAALIMIPIIVREGIEALRGETCGDCP